MEDRRHSDSCRACEAGVLSQPILDNSPGGGSRLAALLVAYILPVCALLAPCQPGAALRIIGNSWLGQDTRSRSVCEKREHAPGPGRPAPPAKSGNSQVVPRQARLLGARAIAE